MASFAYANEPPASTGVCVVMLIRGVVMQIRNGRPPNDERAYGNDAVLYAN